MPTSRRLLRYKPIGTMWASFTTANASLLLAPVGRDAHIAPPAAIQTHRNDVGIVPYDERFASASPVGRDAHIAPNVKNG